MARPARHEQEDYVLRLGRKVRGLRGQRIDRTARRGAANPPIQQLGQRDRTQPDAALLQKPAAADAARVGVAVEMVLAVHGYSFVIVSSKFKSTRETAVQPASSSTVAPLGSAGAVLPSLTANASALDSSVRKCFVSFSRSAKRAAVSSVARRTRQAAAEGVGQSLVLVRTAFPQDLSMPVREHIRETAARSGWSAPGAACWNARGGRTKNRRWARRMSAEPGTEPNDSGTCKVRGDSAPGPCSSFQIFGP